MSFLARMIPLEFSLSNKTISLLILLRLIPKFEKLAFSNRSQGILNYLVYNSLNSQSLFSFLTKLSLALKILSTHNMMQETFHFSSISCVGMRLDIISRQNMESLLLLSVKHSLIEKFSQEDSSSESTHYAIYIGVIYYFNQVSLFQFINGFNNTVK